MSFLSMHENKAWMSFQKALGGGRERKVVSTQRTLYVIILYPEKSEGRWRHA